jgi:LmbE family N-acetylglucosaminyl deacetylase
VFTKSAYAPGLIKKLTPDEISGFRCKEDLDYAKSVGATHCSLDFPDASLCGYTDETELTNDCHDSRFGPVGLAINKSLLELRPDIVLAPLAVGGHIDHRIVLEALRLSVWGKCARIYFYEDLPYAAVLEPASLRAQVAANSGEVKPVVCDISKVLEYKRKALSFYASQQASKNETMLLKYARSIVRGTYSERLWVSDV